MAVTAQTLRLMTLLRNDVGRTIDDQIRDLTQAWAESWTIISSELLDVLLDEIASDGKVTRTQLIRSTRLRRVVNLITEELDRLSEEAGARIIADLQPVLDAAGAAQAAIVDSQLPVISDLVDIRSWARVDARQVSAIVNRITEQITSESKPISAITAEAIRIELFRGVAVGANPRETARRMVRHAEYRFTGGLNRAMVIARTETLDAHRSGAQIGQEQFGDVLLGWEWLAVLDLRTCRSCWAQHGKLHELEEFGPIDHPQGRCGRLVRTKTWAELGFDIEEPPSLVPNAEETFAGLTEAEQRAILGRKGYDAFVAGDFPMDAWSVRRTAKGWRDSMVAAPVPSRSRRRRSA